MMTIRKIQDIILWVILVFSSLFLILYWSRLIPFSFWAKFIPSFMWFFAVGFCLMLFSLMLIVLSITQKRNQTLALSCVAFFLCALIFELPAMESSLAGQRAEQINRKLDGFYKLIDAYQKNHNGMLPQPEIWCDELMKIDPAIKKSDFQLTFYKRKVCFVYNKALENISFSSLSPKTIIIFTIYEPDKSWNLTGDKTLFESLTENGNPFGMPYILLADGSSRGIPKERPSMGSPIVWEP